MLIKQNITKTPRESYHENNTALILENEFFVKIRDDIINEIEKVCDKKNTSSLFNYLGSCLSYDIIYNHFLNT